MSNYITRTCPVCDKEYQADTGRLKHGRQTTCSRKCSYEFRAQKQTTSLTLICMFCGKEVIREPAQVNRKVFCSKTCYDAWCVTRHRNVVCIVCGKHYKTKKVASRHCSRKCFEITHRTRMAGERNPSYIDGRSANATYDAGVNWKVIRRKVYKRDNFRCQICGVKCVAKNNATEETSHRIIQCHHKDPYKRSKNNDLSNLVTLCIRCHRSVHNGKAHV